MARLSENQVIEKVKKPTNSGEVKMGRDYESRLRIFTEPKFKEELEKETAFKEFKDFLKKAISEDKAKRIFDFIQYPLSSCNITKGLMDDLYKVFHAGNSFFSVETPQERGGKELKALLAELNLNDWIEKEGKKVLKNKPNTIVVVDKDEKGKPYLIAVDNERLIDFEFKPDFINFEYVAFLHSVEVGEDGKEIQKIALYDEENYNVIAKKGSNYNLETRTPHGLTFCPCRVFVEERLNSEGKLNRFSPLGSVLSKLQEWQQFDIYKFYTDHYAPFPVVEMVRANCGNDNCNNGFIKKEIPYVADGETRMLESFEKCDSCAENNNIGVGAKIFIEPQSDKDEPTASGKFRFINPETGNLEYLAKKLEDIEEYIELKAVGADNIMSKEAVNEKQVRGSFESKTNVLLNIKTNLDNLYKWIAKTVAALSIGEDKPLEMSVNFGTEWYLEGEDTLQERFKNAKAAGLPLAELEMIYNQLIETKYKGNPDKINRLKTISKLDPLPFLSQDEKAKAVQNGIITKKDFVLSERMPYLIRRFEREQGNLVEFGAKVEEKDRLKTIFDLLNKYADEFIKQIEAEQANSSKEPISGGLGGN